MKALLSAFSGSQSVALPPGTSVSDVQFVYEVAQSNESCVENYQTANAVTNASACTDDDTSIVDTADIEDPAKIGTIPISYQNKAP